jgi:hypothetical protein
MTVAELIQALKGFDGDEPVVVLVASAKPFRVAFDVVGAELDEDRRGHHACVLAVQERPL